MHNNDISEMAQKWVNKLVTIETGGAASGGFNLPRAASPIRDVVATAPPPSAAGLNLPCAATAPISASESKVADFKEKCFMAILGKYENRGNMYELWYGLSSTERVSLSTSILREPTFGCDLKAKLCAEKILELQTENKELRKEMAELRKAFTDLLNNMIHSK